MSFPKTKPDCKTRPFKVRHSLTLQTKMKIIKEFDSGNKVCTITRKYSLPESTVRTIIKNKKRILNAVKNDALLSSSVIVDRLGISKMELILKQWCVKQRKNNVILTQPVVCSQALQIFELLKLQGKTGKNEKFLASKSWFFNFKRRSGWNQSSDNPKTQSNYAECEVVEPNPDLTINKLRNVIEEGVYTPQTVFNVDRTILYWKKMPNGAKSLHSRDRVTLLIGGNAAGDFKLKPLLVYQHENPKALHGKCKGGLPVIWKSNNGACISVSIFEDWFGSNFVPAVERYCSSSGIPFKIMLFIRNEPGLPLRNLIDFDHRVKVVFLPSEDTNYCINPMYQEVAPIFKAQYTRHLFVHLSDSLRQRTTSSVEEAWERYNILDAIRIIVDSWDGVSANDWEKAWEKIFPSLASNYDLNEDSTSEESRNTQIIEEIVDLAAELDIKISDKDVFELLNSHCDDQNAAEELETPDQLAEEYMSINKLTEALGLIKTGLHILEDIDPNEQRVRNTSLELANILRPYEEILCTKIQNMAIETVFVKLEPPTFQK